MQISGNYIPQKVGFYISKYIVQVHHILVLIFNNKIRKGEKMSATSVIAGQKDAAALREATRKTLAKTEREFRGAKFVESWSRIPKIGAGLNKLPEAVARNTAINLQTQAASMAKMTEAQLSTSFQGFTPENMLRLVRLAMPNTCRNKVFTEFAMESAKDSIKYIKPVYSKTVDGGDLHDKHTSNTAGAYQDASKYKDVYNDINEDDFQRALYENTEDRFTQELVNIQGTGGVFTIPATPAADANPFVKASKLIPGYMKVYVGDETHPVAEENKRTGNFFVNTEDYPNAKVTKTVDDETGDITIKVEGVEGDVKVFARFDMEDDFLGTNLGEIELVMSDYKFEPRPTTIGVTWSQLAEITLDASFGLSAQDMLVQYAGDAIRINLDLRSFKLAYGVARSNKDYIVEFDAAYGNGENIEGYFHTAQTFPSAVDTVTDVMVNDINRGGVSRMVAGFSAGSYLKLVKGTFSDKGRQAAKGIYQIGEFGGIPTFKAPSSIIPTNEIMCVWKDDENEGDVAIAFGTLVPFFNTGIIQRKNFYKEAGLATYGDWAVLNRRYLALIRIKGLKDTTEGRVGGMLKYSNPNATAAKPAAASGSTGSGD